MTGAVLHLTDAHDRFDRRVQAAVAADGPDARLDVVGATPGWLETAAAAVVVWLCLPPALLLYGRPLSRITRRRGLPRGSLLAGTRRLVDDVARALAYVRANRAALAQARLVYANDQTCGLVGLLALRLWRVPYIYDAHEMVPFRNRSYGLARRSVEAWLERRIVRAASDCRVVNRPIRRFYRRFYGAAAVSVRANDFYPVREIAPARDGEPCLLYVGAAGGGRLNRLAETAAKLGCRTMLAVDRPKAARVPGASVVGLDGYEDRVADALAGAAPYMWCHLEPSVLSYRFALPNKFFQALSFGIPVVAAPGTYLARIVSVHGVGAVIDAARVEACELWDPELYAERCAAVQALRARLAETKELL